MLTSAPDPGETAWVSQFHALRACANTYFLIVVVDKQTDRIVGAGGVFIERKFLRDLGLVGHIEDIAVDKSQQGKKIGLRIINALTSISEGCGCYKTILNCSDKNIRELFFGGLFFLWVLLIGFWVLAFYEKCGYVKKENEMVGHYCPPPLSV